jgi:MFS-type transporter involved in bile tolerance (Atg22 family)
VIGVLKQRTQHLEYGLYALALLTLVGGLAMLCLPKLRVRSASLDKAPVSSTQI